MPFDKIVDAGQLDARLRDLANAVRTKGGTTAPLDFLSGGFKGAVDAIKTGSPVAPFKKIEVRTWIGDGTHIYDPGIPLSEYLAVFMVLSPFEQDHFQQQVFSIALQETGYTMPFTGGVVSYENENDEKNPRRFSKGCYRDNQGRIVVKGSNDGTIQPKFFKGAEYIVIICRW